LADLPSELDVTYYQEISARLDFLGLQHQIGEFVA